MSARDCPAPPSAPAARRLLSVRRIALLTSVAAIGLGVLFAGPGVVRNLPTINHAQAAENSVRPPSFADIVARVRPSVVSIRVKVEDHDQQMGFNFGDDFPNGPFERFFRNQPGIPGRPHHFSMAQGSGFFISNDGYLVTNYHVVKDAASVEITTDEGKTYTARVVGTDPRTDIALLKVDGRTDFHAVKFADKPPRIGDWVLAVGNPYGLGGTVTAGIVSARGRDIGNGPYDDFIQIDAPVNRGNSGGPTFDADGNVIGVNTAIFSPNGGSIGIGFAIPADTVKMVVAQLKEKGSVSRGWIGVQIQSVTADIADSLGLKNTHGALVAEPQPNSPAAKAGINAGDVIVAVNDVEVKDARDLARKIAAMAPGTTIQLKIIRKGEDRLVSLTLGKMPNAQQASNTTGEHESTADVPKLGLTLGPVGDGGKGVVVVNVEQDSAAAEHGFRSGDVILDVNGHAVANPGDVRKALAEASKSGRHNVLMRVKSGESTKFVALPLKTRNG